MTNKEKEDKIKISLENQDLYLVKSIENINHKPHPFCIGPEHIQRYTIDKSKRCAMYVNDKGDYSISYKKGYHKCGLSYEEHTSDNVCFLQLKRNGTTEEANAILTKLIKDIGIDFIDGFAFVETKQKYRVT